MGAVRPVCASSARAAYGPGVPCSPSRASCRPPSEPEPQTREDAFNDARITEEPPPPGGSERKKSPEQRAPSNAPAVHRLREGDVHLDGECGRRRDGVVARGCAAQM